MRLPVKLQKRSFAAVSAAKWCVQRKGFLCLCSVKEAVREEVRRICITEQLV